MSDLERYLITKFRIRQDRKVDLWPKNMQHPELILFDETDLHEAGVDWREAELGIEHPCRFWAYWEYSDKTKSTGNPYKDVVRLEPIEIIAPAPNAADLTDTNKWLIPACRERLEDAVSGFDFRRDVIERGRRGHP